LYVILETTLFQSITCALLPTDNHAQSNQEKTSNAEKQKELEGCIDDERQFKTAKRLVTPLFRKGFPR